MKEKIVFFGSSKHIIPIIEVLRKNFDLVLVVTTERLPTDPVPSYCIKSKVCYYVVIDFRDKKVVWYLKKVKADIGVLASFGAIIPPEILDVFPKGIINIHPSLLPKYRGPSPIQTAILNEDKVTGVTIIKLDREVDHGPIITQKKELIRENDTAESLYERFFSLAASVMVQIIELYTNGKIKPRKQNHKEATFTKRLTRQNGYIDLNNPPSPEIIDRMIRAYYPWPSAWTRWVTGSDPVREKILKFLPSGIIQVEGKKPMTYKDFLNGYENVIPNSFRDLIEMLK